MPVYFLQDDALAFPHPELSTEEGILAVGGDFSAKRLLLAYQYGIFPWSDPSEPIIWWCPDPRFVLLPKDLKIAKSMRSYFNQKKFEVTIDQAFESVMQNCADVKRNRQSGTWISEQMIQGYTRLHDLGFAHSVEVWKSGNLVGGLYGIALGKVFFGESMFTLESNASKFGFISLVRFLEKHDFQLIDCQQQTPHLGSLGAKTIPRKDFLDILERNDLSKTLRGNWGEIFQKHQSS